MSVHNGIPLKRMWAADGKQEFNLEWPNLVHQHDCLATVAVYCDRKKM